MIEELKLAKAYFDLECKLTLHSNYLTPPPQYSHNNGELEEWQLEGCALNQDINLIVGKNATGKTRTLNVIASLTDFLAGEKQPSSKCCNILALLH